MASRSRTCGSDSWAQWEQGEGMLVELPQAQCHVVPARPPPKGGC